MNHLRAGVVGVGVMGRHHVRVLSQLEYVELVAIHDPVAVDDQLGNHSHLNTNSLDEFCEKDLDYCVIASPTHLHHQIALRMAEANVHCLIEKPVANSVAEAIEIEKIFKAKDLIGAVGHIERFNPALLELRSRLRANFLGSLFQISTRRQGPFPGRIGDVGVVKDLATHDIDLTMWVSDQKYLKLDARTSKRANRPHEDMFVATGELTSNIITSHIVNWLTPFKERSTTVHGEFGVLVADTLNSDITFYSNGSVQNTWDQIAAFRGVSEGDVTRFAIDRREPLLAEHEAFRDLVLGRPHSEICTLSEGREVLQLVSSVLEGDLS